MKDTWFIFDTNGKFLFKTTNKNRANINRISTNFNAKYIIKNPVGYDENKEQHISYNILSNIVIFTESTSFEHMNSTIELVEEPEIVDYKEIVTDLKNAMDQISSLQNTIAILSDYLDSNVETLNSRIDITNSTIDILSDKVDSNTNIIDTVFTNIT